MCLEKNELFWEPNVLTIYKLKSVLEVRSKIQDEIQRLKALVVDVKDVDILANESLKSEEKAEIL